MSKGPNDSSDGVEMKFHCPCCDKDVGPEHFSCKSGEKGGKAGRGESKRRDSGKMRVAALLRWHKKKGKDADGV